MKPIRFYVVDILLSVSDCFQRLALMAADDCVYRHSDKFEDGFITMFAMFKIKKDTIAYILGASAK